MDHVFSFVLKTLRVHVLFFCFHLLSIFSGFVVVVVVDPIITLSPQREREREASPLLEPPRPTWTCESWPMGRRDLSEPFSFRILTASPGS